MLCSFGLPMLSPSLLHSLTFMLPLYLQVLKCQSTCPTWRETRGTPTSGLRPCKGAMPTSLLCKWSSNDALKWATSLHLSCFSWSIVQAVRTYFSLVALSPLINLEIAWDTCQLPGFSYECLQILLVLFILLLNLGQWSTGVFANSEAILWSFANVGNNQISPNWISRVSPGFTRSKWIRVYRRILFQQTNANLLTHIQAPYLQNIMITSLIGFQLLRSAQLNQCGQTKRIFHLASNKSTNIQQIYSWDFRSGLSWFVLKFELFSQLIFTCLFTST